MTTRPEGGHIRSDWLAARFYQNILDTSLTAHGFEASKRRDGKVRLNVTGSFLAQRVKGNSYKVADAILRGVRRNWGGGRMLKTLVRITLDGFPPETVKYRRHATGMPYGLPPERIPTAMREFRLELEERLLDGRDQIALAAWVEYQLDQVIHPYGDGCGRVSKAMGAWVLTRSGIPLPRFGGRDRYLEHIRKGYGPFLAYYRSCVPNAEAEVEEVPRRATA